MLGVCSITSLLKVATQGIPALAISLDNYAARAPEQYMEAARCALPLVKAMAGLLPLPRSVAMATRGYVLNLNAPGEGAYRGYAWARQGMSCSFSRCVLSTTPCWRVHRHCILVMCVLQRTACTRIIMCLCDGDHVTAVWLCFRFVERPRDGTLQPTETSNAQQLDEALHEVAGVREFTRELNFQQYVARCVVLECTQSALKVY